MPVTKYGFDLDLPSGVRLFQDAMNRMFNEPPAARPWAPPVDIYETEHAVVLKADLPDMNPNEVQIQIEEGTLMIKGERKFEKVEGRGAGYHRIERSYGEFARYFSLPDTVDSEHVKAEHKNGVLTISLPKKEAAKPRTIRVDVSE